MSEKRTILSRPRTRVYDCNYNIGAKHYKPMLDKLDRKYSTPTSFPTFTFSPPICTPRPRDDNEFSSIKRPSPYVNDFEPPLEHIRRKAINDTRSLEEDLEDEIANSMRKLKALRSSKAASVEEDLFQPGPLNGLPKNKRFNFSEKILDSVGVNGKLQDALEEDFQKKRTLNMTTFLDEEAGPGLTKWSALREPFNEEFLDSTASARARQSKARITDIENEIEAVAQKGLAREQRISNVKSLIAGEDPFADVDSFKSKKTSRVIKKVTF